MNPTELEEHVPALHLELPRSRARTARRRTPGLGTTILRVAGSWRLAIAVTDATMALLGVAAAAIVASASGAAVGSPWILALFTPLVVAQIALRGNYRSLIHTPVLDNLRTTISATSLVTMLLVTVGSLAHQQDIAPVMARTWIFASVALVLGRVLLGSIHRWTRVHGVVSTPALIVGAGEVGNHVARRLMSRPEYGLEPVGFIDPDPVPVDGGRAVPVMGGLDDLDEVLEVTGAGHVIIAFSSLPDRLLLPLARVCVARGTPVSLVPRLFESVNLRFVLQHVGGMPLVSLGAVDPKGWQFAIKHGVDRVVALLTLIALWPVFAITALAIKIDSPGPVLFRQRRVGRDGHEFDLLKFRSMRLPRDPDDGFRPRNGHAPGGVEGRDRRTLTGRLIRRLSIDELPQLLNVLRGEMSLIGPRPERPEYVSLFCEDLHGYTARHRVKAGITGWAQVHGLRGQTSLADRVEWDNHYIENWSLWLDLKITIMTFAAVLRGE
ncbi:MAG TPA: sugar transferase [Solirubrobacteraceae bacterium]|nr:sugar transferase [Solirubrobacteraceae bacterium]